MTATPDPSASPTTPDASTPAHSPAANTGKGWTSRLPFLLPLITLLAMVGFFTIGLQKDPSILPSELIDQPLPEMNLAALPGRGGPHGDDPLTTEALTGEVSLVNIFGSWCIACRAEHPVLMRMSQQAFVPIHGIDWRERDPADGLEWLQLHGDPYDIVGQDPDSKAAIDLGVTGAPETFVIDTKGVVRYKHIGPITFDDWNNRLMPLIETLRQEGAAG
ncbi:MAG: DsbE family thiol:disulfide interchange protein [Rhodospirillaceae bacterium]